MINKNIPENVKQYIAGLFAGDGNVDLYKSGNGAALEIRIGLCYKPILDKISNILNAGDVTFVKKREKNTTISRKQWWMWRLHDSDAMEFLEMIEMYLPEKKEQAKQAIEFQKWKNKNSKHGKKLTRSKILYCEKSIETVKMLKEQFVTIEDVEKYDLFKKKHYNPDIESGIQNVLGGFDNEFFTISKENKKDIDEAKKLISPDIDLNVIENMTLEGFAGFFDAEGSVNIQRDNSYENNIYYALNVSITNSNFLILDKFYKTFGGNLSDPRTIDGNNKITWLWAIKATNALKFLYKICLYTSEKQEQIKLSIEFQNRKNNKTLSQEKAEYTYRKIMDLHHTEYMINEKVKVLSYNKEKV